MKKYIDTYPIIEIAEVNYTCNNCKINYEYCRYVGIYKNINYTWSYNKIIIDGKQTIYSYETKINYGIIVL